MALLCVAVFLSSLCCFFRNSFLCRLEGVPLAAPRVTVTAGMAFAILALIDCGIILTTKAIVTGSEAKSKTIEERSSKASGSVIRGIMWLTVSCSPPACNLCRFFLCRHVDCELWQSRGAWELWRNRDAWDAVLNATTHLKRKSEAKRSSTRRTTIVTFRVLGMR